MAIADKFLRPNNYDSVDTDQYRGFTLLQTTNGKSIKQIVDRIIDLSIHRLSISTKVLALRIDLKPKGNAIDISRFNKSLQNWFDRTYYSNAQGAKLSYIFVSEFSGTSNPFGKIGSENYHYVLFIPVLDGMTRETLKTQVKRKIVQLSGFTEKEVSLSGYFLLEREMLTMEKCHMQKKGIQDALDNNAPYLGKLNVNKIKTRKSFTWKAVGSVLHEFIFASSYLAKIASKKHLNKNEKLFSSSSTKLSSTIKLPSGRKDQIVRQRKEIQCFFDALKKQSLT